jgi:hypothetical protein
MRIKGLRADGTARQGCRIGRNKRRAADSTGGLKGDAKARSSRDDAENCDYI